MIDHQRGPGFFTFAAESNVLGSQFVLITQNYQEAIYLWMLASVLWIGLTYLYKRFPLAYDHLYWGAVFPQGMYTACTF
jgi:hypothetical protein